jgi:thiol-disulfide isomerase/thioredoxin
MSKFVTVFSALLLVLLTALAAIDAFPQQRYSKKNQAGPKPVTREQADNFAKNYWDHKIVHCGDSRYFLRRERDEGLTLFEVKGVTIESTGRPGDSGKLLWSGSSTARFESYRKMQKSDRNWGPWISNGSDMTYYQIFQDKWTYSPAEPLYVSCSDVDLFTLKPDAGTPLSKELTQAQLKNIDGGNFNLEDYKGKVVLIHLWATWCGPCRMEAPDLVELQKKYQDKGFTVIGLNVDSEDVALIVPYHERLKINFPLVTSDQEMVTELVRISLMNGIPQSFLIGRDGRLIAVFKGYNPNKTMLLMDRTLDILLNY